MTYGVLTYRTLSVKNIPSDAQRVYAKQKTPNSCIEFVINPLSLKCLHISTMQSEIFQCKSLHPISHGNAIYHINIARVDNYITKSTNDSILRPS